MKLLAYVHGYPPAHNAGAEWMLHAWLRWLQTRGHAVTVIATRFATPGVFQGIPVLSRQSPQAARALMAQADCVITHLDNSETVLQLARGVRSDPDDGDL